MASSFIHETRAIVQYWWRNTLCYICVALCFLFFQDIQANTFAMHCLKRCSAQISFHVFFEQKWNHHLHSRASRASLVDGVPMLLQRGRPSLAGVLQQDGAAVHQRVVTISSARSASRWPSNCHCYCCSTCALSGAAAACCRAIGAGRRPSACCARLLPSAEAQGSFGITCRRNG